MKRIVFLLLLFFFCVTGSAVCAADTLIKSRDSIILLIAKTQGSRKADLYLNLAERLRFSDPMGSFRNIENALKVSIAEGYIPGKAEAHFWMASYFSSKRKFTLGLENYLTSLELFRKCNDRIGQMRVYEEIGNLNRNTKNHETGIFYFQTGLNLARTEKNYRMEGVFLERLGVSYQLQENYSLAMVLFEQSITSYRKAGDKAGETSVINCIGSVLMDQKNYDEALSRLFETLPEATNQNRFFKGTTYTRIAHIYACKKDFGKSLVYNKLALEARRQMNLSDDVNSSLINIAGDYFMLNKPDSAWYYMNTALEQARRFDRKNLVENAYRHIYSYYLRKGDYKEAVTYYKRYSIIGDSILMERNTGNIRVIEANQRILRIGESNSLLAKQNQVQALNARNQRFQVIFMQGLTFLAALLVFTFLSRYLFNLYSRRKMQRLNITLSSEINERERAQEQLEQREKQYRFLADHSIDLITRIDKKFKFTYASPSSSRILGYTPEEMVALRTYDMTQADYHGYAESVVGTMLKTQMSKQAIYPAIKKNGSIFWAESVLNPIFDQVTGEFREIVAVTRDIQERKIKEIEIMDGTKQKENLLKEIHHRVKNNFAILVSLINMQKDQTKNPELLQSLTNLQLRIRTMALVHEMLYRSKDFERISFPDYLRSVASVIAGTFNRRDIELVFDLQEATMDIEASIPLGLMINEILSNAFKHAFPGEKGGSIKVRLLNDPGSSNLFLSIEDDGIGLPEGFSIDNCKTMGLQIVQILVRQIEGQLTITSSGGTRFSISFPKAN